MLNLKFTNLIGEIYQNFTNLLKYIVNFKARSNFNEFKIDEYFTFKIKYFQSEYELVEPR